MKDIATEAEFIDAPGGEQLRLRFSGPFEGRQVTWDATLMTLRHWQRLHPAENAGGNFIDIGEEGVSGIRLIVGLSVEQIDLPTVRKAMMMIRQYKRLRQGRHEYGRNGS